MGNWALKVKTQKTKIEDSNKSQYKSTDSYSIKSYEQVKDWGKKIRTKKCINLSVEDAGEEEVRSLTALIVGIKALGGNPRIRLAGLEVVADRDSEAISLSFFFFFFFFLQRY